MGILKNKAEIMIQILESVFVDDEPEEDEE